jgi:hypothetical protein
MIAKNATKFEKLVRGCEYWLRTRIKKFLCCMYFFFWVVTITM